MQLLRDRIAEPAPSAALIARFRRQRPLRGGSLIVTVFGDALAPRGGAITLAGLIALMTPFGLTERLVRTSVARLAADDWLASRRLGRRSEYRLSPTGRRRFVEATARIYSGPPARWDGAWTLVLMPDCGTAERQRLRKVLGWKGFGDLGAGVFAHPTVAPEEARAYLAMNDLAGAPVILACRTFAPDDAPRLVRRGWDLRELAARYERFIRHFAPVGAALAGRSQPQPPAAFAVRTLLIHEYRKIHLRDPLLPRALLPRDWPGTAAYELCRRIYGRVFAAAERHLSATAARLDGPLPPPDRQVRRRFPAPLS